MSHRPTIGACRGTRSPRSVTTSSSAGARSCARRTSPSWVSASTRKPVPRAPRAVSGRQTVALYRSARASLREAETVEDVLAVQDTLCQAWFHLARSDALAAGEEPPSRSDPCFFNPQHGPAVVEVAWAPLGATPTSTPVCRTDAERIEQGLAPRFRQISLGGATVAFHEVRGDDGSVDGPAQGDEPRRQRRLCAGLRGPRAGPQQRITSASPDCNVRDLRVLFCQARRCLRSAMARAAAASSPRLQLALAEFRLGDPAGARGPERPGGAARRQPAVARRRRVGGVEAGGGAYGAARAALRDVASLADVMAVHTRLNEARFHLARAEAIALRRGPAYELRAVLVRPAARPGSRPRSSGRRRARCGPARRDDAARVAAGFAPCHGDALRRPAGTASRGCGRALRGVGYGRARSSRRGSRR